MPRVSSGSLGLTDGDAILKDEFVITRNVLPLVRAVAPLILAIGALGGVSQAAVLAQYGFIGDSAASTDGDGNSVASSVTYGAFGGGTNPTTAAYHAIESGELKVSALKTTSTATLANAITNNQFISFTLDVGTNATSLTSLDFVHKFYSSHTSNDNSGISVLSSLTGFTAASSLASYALGDPAGTGGEGGTMGPESRTVDLSSNAAFQNFTGTVEFRVYFYDSVSAENRRHVLDNITLNGSVIPEPSSVLLLGAAAGVGLVRRRRA